MLRVCVCESGFLNYSEPKQDEFDRLGYLILGNQDWKLSTSTIVTEAIVLLLEQLFNRGNTADARKRVELGVLPCFNANCNVSNTVLAHVDHIYALLSPGTGTFQHLNTAVKTVGKETFLYVVSPAPTAKNILAFTFCALEEETICDEF